jgi:hypothetical protein
MFLHFLNWRNVNSLNPASSGAPIDCTTSIHSTQPFVNIPHTLMSPPLRIQLQLVVCNVCQTQTPFSQTTTAALSVGLPCTYTHVHNKHQCCYLSIFTLLSVFWNEKKNVGSLLSEQTSYFMNLHLSATFFGFLVPSSGWT